jgi:hypothetical protein
MGKWKYSSTILNPGTRWRKVVSFTLLPLCPQGKSPRFPLDRRLGGPQSWPECCGEQKNLLPLAGIEPQFHGHPASSPSLYQLSWQNCIQHDLMDLRWSPYNCIQWEMFITTHCEWSWKLFSDWAGCCLNSKVYNPIYSNKTEMLALEYSAWSNMPVWSASLINEQNRKIVWTNLDTVQLISLTTFWRINAKHIILISHSTWWKTSDRNKYTLQRMTILNIHSSGFAGKDHLPYELDRKLSC